MNQFVKFDIWVMLIFRAKRFRIGMVDVNHISIGLCHERTAKGADLDASHIADFEPA